MNFLKQAFKIIFGCFPRKKKAKRENFVEKRKKIFNSVFLDQEIQIEYYIPHFANRMKKPSFSVLFFNDGQDMEAVDLQQTLAHLCFEDKIKPLLVVALYPKDRMQEYGTAHQLDYGNRGSKAKAYTQFIMKELIPFLEKDFSISPAIKDRAFAGFSLGALSAFDIVWNESQFFGKVGVFSGALWWRSKAFEERNPDANLIVHEMVASSTVGQKRQELQFWFQAGTEDEKEDRNNNGIIDAIDDTIALIETLEKIGFDKSKSIKYVEVEGGKHNPDTWKKVLPDFLLWAFGE